LFHRSRGLEWAKGQARSIQDYGDLSVTWGDIVTEIPGFEIKRELGSSAAATVYLALQTSLDREVALKVMVPALVEDAALTQRFIQEARTLASLAHPHIVAVYDVDTAPDRRPYFSMQYLPGGDLTARVGRGMSESALAETLDGVAQALEYVHQRGLVHRDVRPTNVLYDDSGMPILTDFGIARAVGSASNTGTDFSAATGHYMSPEQARGSSLDARADLYSLGALTWFGLTGRPPYDGADGFAVAYAHVFEAIPRLPPEKAHWQPLIDRALAKEPAQRFASAREFLDALAQVSSGAAQAAAADESATRISAILPAAQLETAAAPAPADSAYATLQRPLPDLSAVAASAPAPAPAAVSAPPSREPEPAAADIKAEAPAPAPAPPAGPIITRRRPVLPAPASTVAATASAAPRPTRWWPLAAVAAGIAVIGLAGYWQFGGKRVKDAEPPGVPVATAPAPASTPALAPPPAPQVPAAAPSPPDGAVASTPSATVAANPSGEVAAATTTAPQAGVSEDAASKTATTDATALPSLDAAAEAAAYVKIGDPALLPTAGDPMTEGIRLGRAYLAIQRLTQPRGNNALEFFQYVLKRDPRSKAAKQGIVDVAKKYLELADKTGAADQSAYLQNLASADDVAKTLDEAADVRKDVAARRAKLAEPYLEQARKAVADWNKAEAKAAFEKVLQIDPNNSAARDGLKTAAMIGEPGYAFRDKAGPEMVVLGGGRAAVARRDVTRGEFRRFWAATGSAQFSGREPACRDRESIFRSGRDRTWQNPGFEQDDSHPVVCVSWPEAAAYAQWLARETGKRYRLLSAGEFDQIASRASDCSANLADASYNKKFDSKDGASCDDGFAATAPAGRFEAGSNVRLWVNACGNGAAANAGCRDHLAKGRSWANAAKDAASDNFSNDVGLNTVGFRVAREIE